MDPESEALVRQLHRELNGLTRRRESGSAVSASFQQLQRRRTKPQNPIVSKPAQQTDKQADKTTSLDKPSSTGGGGGGGTGGSKRRIVQDSGASGSDGEQRTAAPVAAEAKPSKRQRPEKPKEEPVAAAPPAEPHKPHRLKQTADAKRPAAPIKVEAEPVAGTSGQVPEPLLPAAPAKTAIEAAAAVAAAAVRLKAKTTSTDKGGTDSGGSTGPRHVKCFYAGVRWGIMLPPNVLHSRSDLAAALNEAFEGEIVSCGRGERLTVVFLDEEGVVSELPSVRPGSAKENVNKWRQLANRAHRVYVRPAG